MHALLENNRSHIGSCIGIGHDFSLILPNAKNQARSQYKHPHELEDIKQTKVNLSSQGDGVLYK